MKNGGEINEGGGVEGDEPFLMCNDVDAKLALFVLNEVDVGVDTLSLVPPRQLGWNR